MLLKNLKGMRVLLVLVLAVGFSACTNNLQTRVSGNLGKLSSLQTVAILPVEVQSDEQMEMATMFRQNLHANLRQSPFKVLEHYIVDGQLKNHDLMDPSKYGELDPMTFGEVLGVDAVLLSRINRVQKTYFLIHSSIEISVSVEMIDTRSGEILWVAEQTESDIQGIAKIPTGMAAAVIAPIYLVTNKLKVNELTANMVDKLTSIVKDPAQVDTEKTFNESKIATAWNGGKKGEGKQVYWAEVVGSETPDTGKASVSPGILKDGLKKQIPYEIIQQEPVTVSKQEDAGEKTGGLKLTPQPKKVPGKSAKDPSISF
jgi:hypothetical protein